MDCARRARLVCCRQQQAPGAHVSPSEPVRAKIPEPFAPAVSRVARVSSPGAGAARAAERRRRRKRSARGLLTRMPPPRSRGAEGFSAESGRSKFICLFFVTAQGGQSCRRKWSAQSPVRKGRLLTQSRTVDWADPCGNRSGAVNPSGQAGRRTVDCADHFGHRAQERRGRRRKWSLHQS